ncbi:MAG TPA: LacI family DNA-binding transcriptional regulator [Ktedonobacteraceae bacterium]|nr:LacI family DNA-binding transcriptional regulator [Ktedonobacteraceae bacterium]
MAKKLTIQDIARLGNVSIGTVSRVLNNKPDVDPSTRERILRIVEEQGYVPSITAAGLAVGHNRLISVLVPALTWPMIPELMRSVAEIVDDLSYEIVLYSISSSNHERDCGKIIDRILATKLTAGLLAIHPGQSAQHLVELQKHRFPVVLIDDQNAPPDGIPWVGTDNYSGAYEATRHLLRLGHRRIATIQGPMKFKVSRDRYQGFCDALLEAGIPLDPELVLEGDFTFGGGKRCAQEFFERPLAERPTAVFAGSDQTAYGVIAAAEVCGLHIPDDIALVGFDDNPSSAHMQPALTTIRQPFSEMGQRAIRLLLSSIERSRPAHQKRIENGQQAHDVIEEAQRIQLPTTLVIRDSCGASRKYAL